MGNKTTKCKTNHINNSNLNLKVCKNNNNKNSIDFNFASVNYEKNLFINKNNSLISFQDLETESSLRIISNLSNISYNNNTRYQKLNYNNNFDNVNISNKDTYLSNIVCVKEINIEFLSFLTDSNNCKIVKDKEIQNRLQVNIQQNILEKNKLILTNSNIKTTSTLNINNNKEYYNISYNYTNNLTSTCKSNTLDKNNDQQNEIDNKRKQLNNSFDIRCKYYCKLNRLKLLSNKTAIFNNNKSYNSIFIFDWDDTIMFTSEFLKYTKVLNNSFINKNYSTYLNYTGRIKSNNRCKDTNKLNNLYTTKNYVYNNKFKSLNKYQIKNINELLLQKEDIFNVKMLFTDKLKMINDIKTSIYSIFKQACLYGDVFIVSNASLSWISFTAQIFFPEIYKEFFNKKIKIISARDLYERKYNINKWKKEAFKEISNFYNKNLVTNIICVGDNKYELEAAKTLGKLFNSNNSNYIKNNTFLKTVKFKSNPSIEVLNVELILLEKQIKYINDKLKSLSIVIDDESSILLTSKLKKK